MAIRVERWRIEKFGHAYCSRLCSDAAHVSDLIAFECVGCGKPFLRKAWRGSRDNPICGIACMGALRRKLAKGRVAVHCERCDKKLLVWPTVIRRNNRFFCGRKCRSESITGAGNPAYTTGAGRKIKYGPHWRRQRRAALDRDGHKCVRCGATRRLHVHHFRAVTDFGGDFDLANDLDNLVTVCPPCHRWAHGYY